MICIPLIVFIYIYVCMLTVICDLYSVYVNKLLPLEDLRIDFLIGFTDKARVRLCIPVARYY